MTGFLDRLLTALLQNIALVDLGEKLADARVALVHRRD